MDLAASSTARPRVPREHNFAVLIAHNNVVQASFRHDIGPRKISESGRQEVELNKSRSLDLSFYVVLICLGETNLSLELGV